jgi:ABC-type glycerol-3-phosphate transport system permease component
MSGSRVAQAEGRVAGTFRRAVVIGSVAGVVLPLLWIVRTALRPVNAYFGDPAGLGGGLTLGSFSDAWSSGLGHGLYSSLLVAPLASVIATALAALAGYAFAKEEVACKRVLLVVVSVSLVIPLSAFAVPLFDQALQFHYLDSRLALAVTYGALFSGWGTLFLRAYYVSLPDELIDAAKVDGATTWQVFRRIALPLGGPAIASVFVINLFITWGEVIIALVNLPSPDHQTSAAVLAQFSTQFRAGGPLTAAAMLIVVAPIVAAFVVSQRWLRAEVFGGAVKG